MNGFLHVLILLALPLLSWSQSLTQFEGNSNLQKLDKIWDRLSEEPPSMLKSLELYRDLSDQYEAANHLLRSHEVEKFILYIMDKQELRGNVEFIIQLRRLADNSLRTGNILLAKKCNEEELQRLEALYGKQDLKYLKALAFSAELERTFGRLDAAEQIVSSAYQQAEKKGLFSAEGFYITHTLARILHKNGKLAQAETYFRQAESLHRKIGSTEKQHALLLKEYGDLEVSLGNAKKALSFYHEAYDILINQFPKDHFELKAIGMGVADIYLEKEKIPKADSILSIDHKLSQNVRKTAWISWEANEQKVRLLIAKGKYNEASVRSKEMSSSFQQQFGEEHYFLGSLKYLVSEALYYQGKYEEAISWGQQALEIRSKYIRYEHPDRLESISSLSSIYWAQGDIRKARKWYRKSLYYYHRLYETNFAFLSEKEKTLFYKKVRVFFDEFNSFVIQEGQGRRRLYEDMLNNQLLSKGLLFASTRKIRDQVEQDPKYLELYTNWLKARENYAKAAKVGDTELLAEFGLNLDSMENRVNFFEKEISLRVQLSQEQSTLERNLNWKGIRYILQGDEAAIELVRIPQYSPEKGGEFSPNILSYCALIITKSTRNTPDVVHIEKGYELETRILRYYQNAIKYQVTDSLSYKSYWEPVLSNPSMKLVDKIYLSPDGVYNQISISGLYDAEKNEYAIDQNQLVMLGNLTDITKIEKKKSISKNDKFVLLGYPDYNTNPVNDSQLKNLEGAISRWDEVKRSGLDPSALFGNAGIALLPGTYDEVIGIDSLLQNKDKLSVVYLNSEASESNVKKLTDDLRSPTIVHIATHGFFLPEEYVMRNSSSNEGDIDPLQLSGLLFSGAAYSYQPEIALLELEKLNQGGQFQDGVLTAYEAMNLRLNQTELVILSACETGLGTVVSGEGVYGLQRSIQTAGAKSVIMSLWKVSDRATTLFMQYFYQYYLLSGDKQQAFRKAQIDIRKTHPHPFYWSAFVMIGG